MKAASMCRCTACSHTLVAGTKLPSRRYLALKKHQNIFLILRFGKFSGGFNNTVVIDASEKKKDKTKTNPLNIHRLQPSFN